MNKVIPAALHPKSENNCPRMQRLNQKKKKKSIRQINQKEHLQNFHLNGKVCHINNNQTHYQTLSRPRDSISIIKIINNTDQTCVSMPEAHFHKATCSSPHNYVTEPKQTH